MCGVVRCTGRQPLRGKGESGCHSDISHNHSGRAGQVGVSATSLYARAHVCVCVLCDHVLMCVPICSHSRGGTKKVKAVKSAGDMSKLLSKVRTRIVVGC